METEQSLPEAAKKSMYRSLRESVLPVKTNDNVMVKFLKNTGFGVFLIMLSVVSLLMATAVAFAL